MEDRIDFACSDTWRDHYFQMGLTPHPSPNYISSRDRALIEALADIRDAFTSLLEGEPVLPHRPAPSRPFYKPPTPPPAEEGKRGIPL